MTKIRREALKGIIILGICCILLSSGMLADIVFKQGTDGSGQGWDGPINVVKNSNSKVWELDGTDDDVEIQEAIDDVGTYGSVFVESGVTITSEISLNGNSGVILDFQNHNVTLDGDIYFVNITACVDTVVRNARVRANVGTEQTGAIIQLYATDWDSRVDGCNIENIYITNSGGRTKDIGGTELYFYNEHNYTGIYMLVEGHADEGVRIDSNVFRDIWMAGAGTGIMCEVTAGTRGYINGNEFDNVYLDEMEVAMEFKELGGSGMNENTFTNFKAQCNPITIYGLKNISGSANIFNSCLIWDWNTATVCPNGIWAYWIGVDSHNIRLEIQDKTTSVMDDIYDEGDDSDICGCFGDMYYDANYVFKMSTNGTHYFATKGNYGEVRYAGTEFVAVLESAITEISGGTILMTSGTYTITQANLINALKDDIIFEGEDERTTIIKANDGDTFTSGMFFMDGDNNITFRNLCFDGNSGGVGGATIGLYFGNNADSEGLIVDNCVFKDFDYNSDSMAIYSRPHSDDTVSKISIRFSEFINNYYGIYLTGNADPSYVNDTEISSNFFSSNTYNVRWNYVNDSLLTNNIFVDGAITIGSNCANNIIHDNPGYNYDSLHDGYIWNSNGNYWIVSEANFLSAISDAGDQGVVYLPFCSITLTSDLDLDSVIVKGSGCGNLRYWGATHPYGSQTELKLGTSVTITMTNCSKLQDVFINCTTSYDATAIHILAHNNPMWYVPDMLRNVIINKYWSASAVGTGVNISSIHDGASVDGGHIALCSFNDVVIRGFEYGLILYAEEAASTYISGYTNGNMFNNFALSYCEKYITLIEGANNAEVVGNSFNNIQIQPGGFNEEWGIKCNSGTQGNMFTEVFCWDWNGVPATAYALMINGTTDTYATGYFDDDIGYGGASDYYILDISTGDAVTD